MGKIYSFAILISGLFLSTNSYAQSWEWCRGNTGAGMESWPVVTDHSGNVFAAGLNLGSATSAGLGTPAVFGSYSFPDSFASYSNQCVIVKYDTAGNFLWANGTQFGDTWLIGIASDLSGNAYLLGALNSDSVKIGATTLTNTGYPNYSQYFLAKFDPLGNVLWARSEGGSQGYASYTGPTGSILGPGGITTDASCNIYITTNFNAPTVTVGTYTLTNSAPADSTDDILLVKYDSLGNVVWATSNGGAGSDNAVGVATTPAGSVYIVGNFNSPTITFGPSTITDSSGGPGNVFIARYNSSGSPVWASTSGGTGNEFAAAIVADAADNIYMTGAVSDPEISFSGTSVINTYTPVAALYLAKFDASNNVSWYKTIGDPFISNDVLGCAMALSPCNGIWVCGTFGESGFEVSIGDTVLNRPAGSFDPLFIAAFNSVGTYSMSAALQSGADEQTGTGIACDASGNVYVCADYADFPPIDIFVVGTDTPAIAPAGYEWQYLAKYKLSDITVDTNLMHTDTFICGSLVTLLHAPFGYSYYLWNNGSLDTSLSIDTSGIYWVIGFTPCGSSVLIDTITVTYRDSAIFNFPFSHDTTVCGPFALSVPLSGYSFLWQDSSTANSYEATHSGTYYVTVSKDGCKKTDTAHVILDPVKAFFSLSPNSVCKGSPVVFSDSSVTSPAAYLWSFGDGTISTAYDPTHTYSVAGAYNVYEIVTNAVPCADTAYGKIYVDSQSSISLSVTDTIFCQGTYTTFIADYGLQGNAGIAWSMGNGDSIDNKNPLSYAYSAGGTYVITATALYRVCRDTSASRSVTVLPGPVLDLGADTSICKGGEIIYLADDINADNAGAAWLWNTGQTTSSIAIADPGLYWVTVTLGGCQASDSILVKNDCYINIPNAFTPNGDGINDYFFPAQYLSMGMLSFHMSIYNRWGQLIYDVDNTEGSGWDGKFNGIPQPEGVYVYIIDATFKDGQKEHHQGNVTLLK